MVEERREYEERLREEEQAHHWERASQQRMSDISEQELHRKRAFAGQVWWH